MQVQEGFSVEDQLPAYQQVPEVGGGGGLQVNKINHILVGGGAYIWQ